MKSNTAKISDLKATRQIQLLSFAAGISALAFSITYPFLPIYLHSTRGIPMSTVGIIFLIMGIASILGSPVSGYLIDRYNSSVIMFIGPVIRAGVFAVLSWLVAIDAPFWMFTAALFVVSFMGNFYQNGSNTYITDLIHPDDRIIAFSKVRVGLNIGWMIGPAIGSFLARTPYSLLFSVTALLCLCMSYIPFRYSIKLKLSHKNDVNNSEITDSFLTVLKKDRLFLLLLFFSFLFFLSETQFFSTFSIYVTDSVGVSKFGLGFLYTLNGAIVILFLVPINKWLKDINKFQRIGWGALIYAVVFLGLGISKNWVHLAIFISIMTFGEMISKTAIISSAGVIAKPQMLGRYMGILGLVQGLAWGVGPYIGALLYEKFNQSPFLLWCQLASFIFISGMGFLWLYFKMESSLKIKK